jgi:hypothetical protein
MLIQFDTPAFDEARLPSTENGTGFALHNSRKWNEVSSFPSFPPPTDPAGHPPRQGHFFWCKIKSDDYFLE